MWLFPLGSSSFIILIRFFFKELEFLSDFSLVIFSSTLETSIAPCCQECNRVQKILNNLPKIQYKFNFLGQLPRTEKTLEFLSTIIYMQLQPKWPTDAECSWKFIRTAFFFLPKILIAEMKERNNKVEKLQNEAIKMIKGVMEYWRRDKIFQNGKINAKRRCL